MEKYFLHKKNNQTIGCSNIPVICDNFECIECSKQDYDDCHNNLVSNINKLSELTNWFDNYFDKQLTQSQWQDDFEVSKDPYFKDESDNNKTYANIDELKAQAKIVRDEIRNLREK